MNADLATLLKPLNLTRHNCKNLTDFSAVYGLVASVSGDTREALLDELMILAIRANNIEFVQSVNSMGSFVDRVRIQDILSTALVEKRVLREQHPVTEFVANLWSQLTDADKHEIVALMFSTTTSISGDKDFDLQMTEQSLKALSILNGGNVDSFVNTILAAQYKLTSMRSEAHAKKTIELIGQFTDSPAYDHYLLDAIGKYKSLLKGYAKSLQAEIKQCIREGKLTRLEQLITSHLHESPDLVAKVIKDNHAHNWLSAHHSTLQNSILHGDWSKGSLKEAEKQLIDFFLEHPKFEHNLKLNKQLGFITGSNPSNYVVENLYKRGIELNVPYSKFGEDENIFYSIVANNPNPDSDFKKAIASVAIKMNSIQKFSAVYDALRENGDYHLVDEDANQKIKIVAALLYYENNAHPTLPREQRPAENALKANASKTTDPFFMISGISRWLADELSSDTVYQVNPKDSQYLMQMMQFGLLEKTYVDKLNDKHKRQLLDGEMGL